MSDITVNDQNPWADFQDPILSSEQLSDPSTIAQVAGMEGIQTNTLLDGRRNFSADEIAERAERASKSMKELSPSEKAQVEELHYQMTGEYRRKYY